jgi:hypothetical protein
MNTRCAAGLHEWESYGPLYRECKVCNRVQEWSDVTGNWETVISSRE